MRFVLVSYDIVDDHARARVASVLLGYGRRVQKSVFECVVSERQLLQMKERISRLVDFGEDSVRFYFLCRRCIPAIELMGLGTVTQDESDWVFIV